MSLHMLGAVEVRDTRPMDAYANTVEAEFLAMKKLADDAKWPADLSSKITGIDKAWQDAKASANAAKITVARSVGPDSDLRKSIQAVTAEIRSRLVVLAPGNYLLFPAYAVGGGVLLGALVLFFRRLMR